MMNSEIIKEIIILTIKDFEDDDKYGDY